MTILVLAIIVGLCGIALMDRRRAWEAEHVLRSEKIRLRLSKIRHRLVMFAGSAEMEHRDRRFVEFLYPALTGLLRCSEYYRDLSALVCAEESSAESPATSQALSLRRGDVPSVGQGLLLEYVDVANDIIEGFANPVALYLATCHGRSVREHAVEIGQVRRRAKSNRERAQKLRDLGSRSLQAQQCVHAQ